MNRQRILEFVVGLFMLAGIIALMVLALKVSDLGNSFSTGGYYIKANFANIGGLKVRAPVTLAGVKVGQVDSIKLDPTTFNAEVTLKINHGVKLPFDTSAAILTEGLLGSNYIGLTPGYKTTDLKNGGEIVQTHPALILENLIGQLIYKVGGSK